MKQPIIADWQCVPSRFHYFREAVQVCGETRIVKYDQALGRHVPFVENVTREQLAQLVAVYKTVLEQDDLESLWDWLDTAANGSEPEKAAAWHIRGIIMVLSDLAENGVAPFCQERVNPCRPKPPLQGIGVLAQLPESLSYLIDPALKYGRYQCEEEMSRFLEHAPPDEMEALAMIAERVLINDHYPHVNRFLNRHSIVDYEEAARLYFLFGVLDCAGFQFDHVPEE